MSDPMAREALAAMLWKARHEPLTWEKAKEVASSRGLPPSSLAVAQTWRAADALLGYFRFLGYRPAHEVAEAVLDDVLRIASRGHVSDDVFEALTRLRAAFPAPTEEPKCIQPDPAERDAWGFGEVPNDKTL